MDSLLLPPLPGNAVLPLPPLDTPEQRASNVVDITLDMDPRALADDSNHYIFFTWKFVTPSTYTNGVQPAFGSRDYYKCVSRADGTALQSNRGMSPAPARDCFMLPPLGHIVLPSDLIATARCDAQRTVYTNMTLFNKTREPVAAFCVGSVLAGLPPGARDQRAIDLMAMTFLLKAAECGHPEAPFILDKIYRRHGSDAYNDMISLWTHPKLHPDLVQHGIYVAAIVLSTELFASKTPDRLNQDRCRAVRMIGDLLNPDQVNSNLRMEIIDMLPSRAHHADMVWNDLIRNERMRWMVATRSQQRGESSMMEID